MPGKVFQNDVGMYTYSPGLSSVGSYQVSGIPFATSSDAIPALGTAPLQISFPYVTKNVTVHLLNKNKKLRVGFSQNGVTGSGTNYFVIDSNSPSDPITTFDVKCSSIFLLSDSADILTGSVYAGLTSIQTTELVNSGPSGNNWSGSVGVG